MDHTGFDTNLGDEMKVIAELDQLLEQVTHTHTYPHTPTRTRTCTHARARAHTYTHSLRVTTLTHQPIPV